MTALGQLGKVWDLIDPGLRPWLGFLALTLLVVAAFESLGVAVIFAIFQLIVQPDWAARAPALVAIRDALGIASPETFLAVICVVLFALFVLKTAINVFAVWLKLKLQWRIHGSLATELFSGYLRTSYLYHLRTNSAVPIRNSTSNVADISQKCILSLSDVLSDGSVLIALSAMLIWLQPVAGLSAFVALGIAALAYWRIGQPHFVRWGAQLHDIALGMYRAITEPLQGVKIIKVLGREEHFVGALLRQMERYEAAHRRNMMVQQLPRLGLEMAIIGVLLGAILLTVLRGQPTAEIVPALALFGAAAYRMMPALIRLSAALQNFRMSAAAAQAIHADLLAFRAGRATLDRSAAPASAPAALRDALRLENVTLSYDDGSAPALDQVNLVIARGQSVGLVGASGAGKTSLADVLLGLLPPSAGRVTVDGVDLAADPELPRRLFGYVPQDTFLIDDTIQRNIALGLADGAIDPARIDRAIEMAALGPVIAALPAGLDTVVGERGVRLSGGQRQRLGIARALYGSPEVLILDEATSALDSVTEAEVTDAIDRLRGTRTLVIIAHRLSTIRRCDRLFLLERGRLIDSGSFLDLIDRNSTFRAMVRRMQLETGEPTELAPLRAAAAGR